MNKQVQKPVKPTIPPGPTPTPRPAPGPTTPARPLPERRHEPFTPPAPQIYPPEPWPRPDGE